MTDQQLIAQLLGALKVAHGDLSIHRNGYAAGHRTHEVVTAAIAAAEAREGVPDGYAVFNVGALEAILYQNCPALRIKDADMAKTEMKRVLSGALLAKGDV